MNQELESHFDEFDKLPVIRRKLLPWWIKTFCWIFMFLAICALSSIIMSFFYIKCKYFSLWFFE
jgi:hypothetical protein